MKNLCILCFIILHILIIPSCNIDDTTPNPTLRLPFENLNELVARQDIEADTSEIDATIDETIVTSNGAKIIIEAGSFNKNNQPVGGNISIITKELLLKSQMVLLDKASTSSNSILEYGGIIDFNAFKDGEELDLQGVVSITLPVHNQVSTLGDMSHYKRPGAWMLVNNSPVDVDTNDQTLHFNADEQGWMCGAMDTNFNDLATVEASLFGFGTILTDITGYIVLSDFNTVIKMDSDVNGVKVSKSNIPKGMEVSIVILAMDHFKLFMGIETVQITDDLSIEIKMNEVTEAELPEALQILD
jgi:hypothetical protein